MTSTWKHTERKIAALVGGQRTSKTGLGSETPDVENEAWSVEVKHRATVPEWLSGALAQSKRNATPGKLPLVVIHQAGARHCDDMVMVRLADFVEWFGELDGDK
jgi:hypothetical protein